MRGRGWRSGRRGRRSKRDTKGTKEAQRTRRRKRARDARRKTDLDQLRTALELYYDANGSYPLSAPGPEWFSSEPSQCCGISDNNGNWIPGIKGVYIPTLPQDPRGSAGVPQPVCGPWISAYLYKSDGTRYTLLSHCAPETPWTSSDGFYDPNRPTWAWKVCSDSNACIW